MEHLFSGVLPFVLVAEERSFSRAAKRLGVTVAATSKAVRQLEDELKVQLLERTSRSVGLTRAGEAFLGRARDAVALVRSARSLARASELEPGGPFTLSLPDILSRRIMPACARLSQRYPDLTIHLRFTDQLAGFTEDSVEAAIRVGPVGDKGLVAQLLFLARWVTVGSPVYLARHGTPRHPADLASHRCLKFVKPRGSAKDWTFRDKIDHPSEHTIPVRAALDSNHGDALIDAALAGLGLTQVFDFMAAEALHDGRLVEVLGEWSCAASKVHLVYPTSRRMSPRAHAVLQTLREELRRDAERVGIQTPPDVTTEPHAGR